MMATLLTLLFAFGALAAIGTIWANVRRYGPSARGLFMALQACEETHELRFTITDFRFGPCAAVLRPDFSAHRLARRKPAPMCAAA